MNKKTKEKRTIFSIDLKSFYASVECVDRGLDPFKTPLVVCDKERGTNTIILAVTPYLKERGVPSRLRLKELPKDIPNLIYAKPRMARYMERSVEVVSIFLDYVAKDDLHTYSIDESFLDVTDYLKINNCTAVEYAQRILKDVKDKTNLICTCGIGENIFMAKCAMDIEAKHNKNFIAEWSYKDIPNKLWPVTPLSKMWGIGPRLEKRLHDLGIYSIGDIAASEYNLLKNKFGVIGEEIYNHSYGRDEALIGTEYTPESRSLSVGQVLMRDYNYIEMEQIVKDMVEELGEKLRHEKKLAGGISLFILYSGELGGFAKQFSLPRPTDSNNEILNIALMIYRAYIQDLPIRRIGLFAFNLSEREYQQMDLFTDFDELDKEYKYNTVMDAIKSKYGKNSIVKANALLKESNALTRNKQIGGHSE